MQALLICIALCAVAAAVFIGLKYRAVVERFRPILSLDAEVERVRKETEKNKTDSAREIERAKFEAAEAVNNAKGKAADLNSAYSKAKEIYDRLQHEVSLLEATSEDMSFGLYKPQFSFDTSVGLQSRYGEGLRGQKGLHQERLCSYLSHELDSQQQRRRRQAHDQKTSENNVESIQRRVRCGRSEGQVG